MHEIASLFVQTLVLHLYTEMMTQFALVRVPEPLGPDEQSVQED